MAIESRTIVGVATAVAVIGGAVWAAANLFDTPSRNGTVEITQVAERSWVVEVKDLGAADAGDAAKTAAVAH